MFKPLIDLLRGSTNQAAEALAARHALVILDQQLRDAAAALTAGQRALAMAMAQEEAEARRRAAAAQRIAVLEDQARAALAAGREDLALRAAEAIATLERDSASHPAAAEIARLRTQLDAAARRYEDLLRGRRLAQTAQATRALAGFNPGALSRAEATLAALRTSQTLDQDAAMALDQITATPERITAQLNEAGFGATPLPDAHTILARLRPLAITNNPEAGA